MYSILLAGLMELTREAVGVSNPMLSRRLLALSLYIIEQVNPRVDPEIWYFGNFLKTNGHKFDGDSRLGLNKRVLFIPATNGGTISILFLVAAMEHGLDCYLRQPRRGLDAVTERLLNIVVDFYSSTKRRVSIISDDEIHSLPPVNLTFAWGSDSTRIQVLKTAKSLGSELVFFGSRISASVLCLNTFERMGEPSRSLGALSTDILTFDQCACTSVKFLTLIGNYDQSEKFLNQVNEYAGGKQLYSAQRLQRRWSVVDLKGLNDCFNSGSVRDLDLMKATNTVPTGPITWIVVQAHLLDRCFDRFHLSRFGNVYVSVVPAPNNDVISLDARLHFQTVSCLVPDGVKINAKYSRLVQLGLSNSLSWIWEGYDLTKMLK